MTEVLNKWCGGVVGLWNQAVAWAPDCSARPWHLSPSSWPMSLATRSAPSLSTKCSDRPFQPKTGEFHWLSWTFDIRKIHSNDPKELLNWMLRPIILVIICCHGLHIGRRSWFLRPSCVPPTWTGFPCCTPTTRTRTTCVPFGAFGETSRLGTRMVQLFQIHR